MRHWEFALIFIHHMTFHKSMYHIYISNPTTIAVSWWPIFMIPTKITMHWVIISSLYIIRTVIACNALHCNFTSSNEDFTSSFYILFPFADMYCSTTMIHSKQPFHHPYLKDMKERKEKGKKKKEVDLPSWIWVHWRVLVQECPWYKDKFNVHLAIGGP